jgi:F-type H+-transporting ATPase subunit c
MKNILNKKVVGLITLLASSSVFAEEAAQAVAADPNKGIISIAAALAIGVAALGGALAQGKAASAALDGIARNPSAAEKIQTPMILGLALIESLVIYALVVALLMIL